MTEFTGKVVVVTGASQGIGREVALALAREGSVVALAARNRDRLEAVAEEVQQVGGRALVVPTDVRDPGAMAALGEAVHSQLGVPDLLVSNSGIAGPSAVLWEQHPEDFEETLKVNTVGVFLCCHTFLPTMVSRGSGNIVVIGSMTGKSPLYGRTPYATSKTALIGLVRTLASEAGPVGIRVNLISPGPVSGERLDKVLAKLAKTKEISVDEAHAQFVSASPIGAFVDPAEIADAVLFLASDRAGKITGEDLNVSAGAVTYG